MIGYLPNGQKNYFDFTLNLLQCDDPLQICCVVNSVDSDPYPVIVYKVGQGLKFYQLPTFYETPNCLFPINYKLFMKNGSTLPNFITLDGDYIIINTIKKENKGTYKLEALAWLNDWE